MQFIFKTTRIKQTKTEVYKIGNVTYFSFFISLNCFQSCYFGVDTQLK